MIPLKNGYCNSFVSLRALCRQLRVEQDDFLRLASDAQSLYRHSSTRKGDKSRQLDKPSRELKALQRSIVRNLLRRYDWPDYLHGAIRGRSARSNAERHVCAATLMKVDVRDYFPSITHHAVFSAWRSLHFSPTLAHHLTRLTTYAGHLPQGAPTSAGLANLILMPYEADLVDQVSADGHTYTRYIDDIAVSGPRAQPYVQDAVRVVQRAGFKVSRKKTQASSRQTRLELTGYALNSGRPTISRKYRDSVRARIYRLQGEAGDDRLAEVRSILGRIAYVSSTNSKAAERLHALLESAVTRTELEKARTAPLRRARW